MKNSAALCALLVVIAPLSASAQRKGMGPSAIQAARLKKSPPPNYLSHYLPDDRYKIAGKVWKYVSTDLDTYYHIPSSPNMLRQPASRVIGFANAKDAQEAGYVADPTDGTARSVAASAPRSELMPNAGAFGRRSASGSLTAAEDAYLVKIDKLLNYADEFKAAMISIPSLLGPNTKGMGNAEATLRAMPAINRGIAALSNWSSNLSRLTPPRRFQAFHVVHRSAVETMLSASRQFKQALQSGSDGATAMQNLNKGRVLLENSFKLFPK